MHYHIRGVAFSEASEGNSLPVTSVPLQMVALQQISGPSVGYKNGYSSC